jgi:hypothetical protein
MKATVSSFNLSLNSWQARTSNDIALAFSIEDGTRLQLNEVLEVDLLNLLSTQTVTSVNSGRVIKIRIRDIDLHDLRLPSGHGTSRVPTVERLSAA